MRLRRRKLRPHLSFKNDELIVDTRNVSTKGSLKLNSTNTVLDLITLISTFQTFSQYIKSTNDTIRVLPHLKLLI